MSFADVLPLIIWVCLCYFSGNYFWKSNALSQEVLAENGFWHEIATQGHSRPFILQSINYRPTRGIITPFNIAGLISKVSESVATEIAKNCRLSTTAMLFDAPAKRNPRKYSHWPTFFAADIMGLSSFNELQNTHLFCDRVHIGRSRSSKVDNFGTNRNL